MKSLITFLLFTFTIFSRLTFGGSTTTTTSEGLEIEILSDPLPVPCERKTEKGDTISMHYRGRLTSITGTEFDASYNRGQPLTFKLGAGNVIKGWDEGLLGMCIGEKRRLTIPPALGYGDRNMGPIPAGSILVFDTECVGIKGYTPPPPPPVEEEKGKDKDDTSSEDDGKTRDEL